MPDNALTQQRTRAALAQASREEIGFILGVADGAGCFYEEAEAACLQFVPPAAALNRVPSSTTRRRRYAGSKHKPTASR